MKRKREQAQLNLTDFDMNVNFLNKRIKDHNEEAAIHFKMKHWASQQVNKQTANQGKYPLQKTPGGGGGGGEDTSL